MEKSKDPKKLAFILYENNSAPSYFEISKSLFRFLFIGLPFVAFLSILISVGGALYFKQIKRMVEKKEPKIIAELKSQRRELLVRQKQLEDDQKKLEEKLASGGESSNPSQQGLDSLALFKDSPNRKDLSQAPEVSLDEFRTTVNNDKLLVEFKITNLTKEQKKIAGFLFVVMHEGSKINVWPANSFEEQEMSVVFNKGELFATTRFRPVLASFDKPKENELLFKVLIFNRLGDLMFKKIISHTL
jgi:hypothetical protein